jgi:tetratricopeptide (TPR) repeat protein
LKAENRLPKIPTSLLILAAIMAGGLLLRLIFYVVSLPTDGAPYIRDEPNYVGLAVPLSQGEGYVDKWIWVRPPGYPVYLAAFLLLPGGSLSLAALVQILLSVVNIGIVYALALEVFGGRGDVPRGKVEAVGLVSAGLVAVNPHLVFYANLLMPETLYMLALSVVALLMLRALKAWEPERVGVPRRVLALVALAGLAAAAGVLLRSPLLSFVPLLLAWFWWVLPRARVEGRRNPIVARWSRMSLVPLVVFMAAMFAVILPWTVRNYVRYDRFLLVDTVGGYHLWLYNDLATGTEEIRRQLTAIPNPVDRERYAPERGMAAILSDPTTFARAAVERLAEAWPVDEFREFRVFMRDKYAGTDCTNMDLFAWAGTTFYVGLGMLAVWGFALAPGRAFKGLTLLVALHYAATTMVAHAEFRYRIPLYPFASVFAGWALVGLYEWARSRRSTDQVAQAPASRGPLIVAAVVSLLFVGQSLTFALPGFPNSIRYERRYLDGKSRLEKGDYPGALAAFLGAAEIDGSCASLYRNIGLAHHGMGKLDKERAAYTQAISIEEHDWRTRALLSDRLRAAGGPRAANPVAFTRPEYRAAQQRWAWEELPPPNVPEIDVGAADIGYVMDFHAPEGEEMPGGGSVTYRWSTEQSYLRLVPPGVGPTYLTIRWHSLAWPGKPDPDAQVRVVVNGREVGTLTAHPAWEEASLKLPDVGANEPLVIELLTQTSRPPGGERRLLGVAVDWMRLTSDE